MKWLAGLALLAVAGCAPVQAAVSSQSSSAPAAAPSCAYSFSEHDGSTVVVTGSGGTVCTGLQSGLAHDGNYWGDFTGTLGGDPAYCTLYGDGGTLTVFQVDWYPDDTSVAEMICASEEANGWSTS